MEVSELRQRKERLLQQILILDFEVVEWSQGKKKVDFYVEPVVKYTTKTTCTASGKWMTIYELNRWVKNMPADL